ncbi:hypothetical protein [Pseudoalteromonas piscicida]|uniref:hypothetical protein n=1 Tax=Pseudoalteromonas piscicida TaxID=43662 RepID=UPI003C7E978E
MRPNGIDANPALNSAICCSLIPALFWISVLVTLVKRRLVLGSIISAELVFYAAY